MVWDGSLMVSTIGYPTTRSTASMNSCPGTPSRHQIPKLTADPPGAGTPDAYLVVVSQLEAVACDDVGPKLDGVHYRLVDTIDGGIAVARRTRRFWSADEMRSAGLWRCPTTSPR